MVCVFKLMILGILPKGRKIGNKLVKGETVLDDKSLTVTASSFVEYLEEVKRKCGVKPILVGSDSEKSSPQSQNGVPAQLVVTP